MATRHESHRPYDESPHREASTAPRKNVYYEDYEDLRAPKRQPSFIQRSNSARNEGALVLRERTRSRPTRTFSSDRRQDSWDVDATKAGGSEPIESHLSPWSGRGFGSRERVLQKEGKREPPARARNNIRDSEARDLGQRNRSTSPPLPPGIIDYSLRGTRGNSPIPDGPSMKGVQVVLGPEFDRDVTIHLELDIEGDVESRLEEFSQMKRLGNFHAAEQYFQTNLREYLDVPPVAVEYAEMLLQQGAYQRLKDLLQKKELNAPVPPPSTASSPRIAPVPVAGPATRGKNREIDERLVPPRPQSAEVLDEHSYTTTRHYQDGKIKSDAEKFDLAFRLIDVTAQMRSQGLLWPALLGVDDIEQEFYSDRKKKHRLEDSTLSSTEIQLINYWHVIQSYASSRSSLVYPSLAGGQSIWSDWSGLYDSLREEGRIWELKDVISSSLADFGCSVTWANLFSKDFYAPNFFEEFLDDWGVNYEYDESTYLAILAILVELCQELLSLSGTFFDRNAVATAKRCLEHARRFAECIKENDPQNVKSRPYISWIIAQKGLEREIANTAPGISSNRPSFSFQYLRSLPGFVAGSILPIYVPLKSENPEWPASDQPAKEDELLQHALKASRELGDYKTEVACLQEMICRSPQPKQLFDRLAHVQNTLQGDMVGYLETLLSKYLLVTDEESRQSLTDELSAFDTHQFFLNIVPDPLTRWCERMVQAALYRSSSRYSAETARVEQMALDLSSSLPKKVYQMASSLGFQMKPRYPGHSNYSGMAPARYARSPSPPPSARGAKIERRRADYERERVRYRPRNEVNTDVMADELEKARKELEAYKIELEIEKRLQKERELYKLERTREEERQRLKKELELENLLREKKRETDLKRIKEGARKPAEGYKQEEIKKGSLQEEEERKYQARLAANLQKAGLGALQIAAIQGTAPVTDVRSTYTRVARKRLSIETLRNYHIDYEFDQDPDYVVIKRGVPEYELEVLSNHTKKIRWKRGQVKTMDLEGGTEVNTGQKFEAHSSVMSSSRVVHPEPFSSEDDPAKVSWPHVYEGPGSVDMNRSLSPRAVDSQLHSGDVNNLNTPDHKVLHEYDDYSLSSRSASGGSLKNSKGKGKEIEIHSDDESINSEENQDDAASERSDEAITTEELSPSRILKIRKMQTSGPKDTVFLDEQSPPENLQRLQMQISKRPEGGNKVIVTEQSSSPKLKKRPTFAHVESVEDADDIAGKAGNSESGVIEVD